MPRDLKQTDRNEFKVNDTIGGCQILLFWRHPTTTERIGFQRDAWQREGKKVYNRTPEARAKYGELILTGIREGDFSDGIDADGNPVLIASDPHSPNYRANWKELVAAAAGDLLMSLGMRVFEGSFQELVKAAKDSGAVADEEEDEIVEGGDPPTTEEGADVAPLEASSNG